MSGTVAASAKARLVGANNVLSGLPGLAGVEVAYTMPRNVPRELIYGGKVSGQVELAAMRGSTGRVKRQENLNLTLHIRVHDKGQPTTETVEARVAEIAIVVENWIAANSTLGDLPNLKLATVESVEIDSGIEDDSATAELTLTIGLVSFLS